MENTNVRVGIKLLPDVPEAYLPSYATSGSVGVDLFANILGGRWLQPSQTLIFSTGVCVEVPAGYELQVRSRSGLAAGENVFVLNSPGTIDQDFRGEIKVILHNCGSKIFRVKPGMRIAQAVLCPIYKIHWVRHDELSRTDRGDGGFGSTGA